MQTYKKENNILDLTWEKQDFFDKLAKYDGEKASLNLKLQAINDLEKYILTELILVKYFYAKICTFIFAIILCI